VNEWDGKESSCACNCGFDIPAGGTLKRLTLSEQPLGIESGGTGARTKVDARNNLGFFCGKTDVETISATSPKTVTIPFGVLFASIPNVVITPQCSRTAVGSLGIFAYIMSITETECSVRLTTNYTDNLSVSVQWFAIGDY
jgi:hypothetical protein